MFSWLKSLRFSFGADRREDEFRRALYGPLGGVNFPHLEPGLPGVLNSLVSEKHSHDKVRRVGVCNGPRTAFNLDAERASRNGNDRRQQ